MDTVFIDESKTRGYTVAAATVSHRDIQKLRREVAKLRKSGQARVHMVKEGGEWKSRIAPLIEDVQDLSR
ncbi:hypothetical protein [Subtercola boreus]|uniref:hypothetical protein n=1 Tax=Subtercola boreus TaxID=120213 RepID=UPI00115187DA|nr:hypothetical protein [Subtercola boreus]TQL52626.1 hypothetical protein FB464_0109 [Subtercola boreus]